MSFYLFAQNFVVFREGLLWASLIPPSYLNSPIWSEIQDSSPPSLLQPTFGHFYQDAHSSPQILHFLRHCPCRKITICYFSLLTQGLANKRMLGKYLITLCFYCCITNYSKTLLLKNNKALLSGCFSGLKIQKQLSWVVLIWDLWLVALKKLVRASIFWKLGWGQRIGFQMACSHAAGFVRRPPFFLVWASPWAAWVTSRHGGPLPLKWAI